VSNTTPVMCACEIRSSTEQMLSVGVGEKPRESLSKGERDSRRL
jgi:hypothetical protein